MSVSLMSRSCRSSSDAAGRTRLRAGVGLGTAAVVLLAGCGGGGGGDGGGGDEPEAGGAVSFEEAEQATIQIQAVGTFEEPGEGSFEAAGRGSGFIIDPSGLAVTNNHVVVGAGTLEVWLMGETHSAKILGSSECLDLAVIDLEGDGFPYMEWYEGEVTSAQEVWAVGFPLGDPEFTITAGIVSKTDTPGDMQWASLDHTIEHDARIRPGNSGGPLIAEDGRVVGVNYAGDDENDINLAIAEEEVLQVLDDLQAGTDVLSLGINGQAWVGEDGSSGIFVASVASGSSADKAGIAPGDLVTKMEGVTLATDGTMSDYCQVLRTHGSDDTLAVEVYRPSEDVFYVGQVNGEPLVAESVPTLPGGGEDGGSEPPAQPADFVTVTDDTGQVTVDVPSSWGQVDGASYEDENGNVILDVTASPDIQAFQETWDVSGVSISASSEALASWSVEGLLDTLAETAAGACTPAPEGRQPYSDGLYTGSFEAWGECGGVGTTYVVIAAQADDGSHLVWVRLQLVAGEEGVLETVVSTFQAAF
ncbi:S1C family serine protease [Actinotalea ferrariae]|uniref:S1C family serine protease n=1 Tax=Actinotalea ferrariae TaxID=1386098 RepID=UPI0012DEFFB9|nr:trypsin-like peptidase domain-containing protein [Actinotalea ferrariae]